MAEHYWGNVCSELEQPRHGGQWNSQNSGDVLVVGRCEGTSPLAASS
jgi:hypothetical protein